MMKRRQAAKVGSARIYWTCNLRRHETVRAPGSSGRPVGDDIGRPISTGMLSLQPVRNIGTAFAQGSSGHPVCDTYGAAPAI